MKDTMRKMRLELKDNVMKRIGVLVGIMVLGLFAWNVFYNTENDDWVRESNAEEQLTINTSGSDEVIIPTVFLHGYRGGDESLSNLIEGLTGKASPTTKTVKVPFARLGLSQYENMTLGYDGQEYTYVVDRFMDVHKYSFRDRSYKSGYVKVVFMDNTANLFIQTCYLNSALKQISKDFSTDRMNIVGHSMGGVTSAIYGHMNYNRRAAHPSQKDLYQINKLVTIGSPIYGAKRGILKNVGGNGEIDETLLQNLLNNGKEFKYFFDNEHLKSDPKLMVLSIGSNQDEWVAPDSAFALKHYILPSNIKLVVSPGRHSPMTHSEITIQEIKSFL